MLIVPFIAAPMQNTLYNLQLAHPLTDEREFNISLLIGADHYWDIVGDHVVRGHGPTAVESKLGYLLSGPMQPAPYSPAANVMMVTYSNYTDFDLEHFWSLECVGVSLTEDTTYWNIISPPA